MLLLPLAESDPMRGAPGPLPRGVDRVAMNDFLGGPMPELLPCPPRYVAVAVE